MTFITSYLMRNLIRFLSSKVFGGGKSVLTEQVLTIVCFILLVVGLYGTGKFFVPRLTSQGQALVQKVGSLEESPRAKLDTFLRKSIGKWLLVQHFGDPTDSRYQSAFSSYMQNPLRAYEFEEFGKLYTSVLDKFEKDFLNRFFIATDEDDSLSITPISRASKQDREQQLAMVKNLRERNPVEYSRLFAQFYERTLKNLPGNRYSLEIFNALSAAHKEDPEQFSKIYKQMVLEKLSPSERLAEDRKSFEFFEARHLVSDWKKGAMAEKIGTEVDKILLKVVGNIGNYLGALLPMIVTLPIQLTLSLLLSFFITFDIPKMARGIQRLKTSRVSHIYEEIAPGLLNFGKLIGRAFQAQGVIAFVNTVLTFGVISLLGIENGLFLAAIVFICSFIPVLGVVISGIPIAAMAIVQDGGGFAVAAWAVVGILVVHFIETSILNPKIVGTFLHLHPVLVLAILAIGEHFFGVWGLLLGVPVMVYVIRFVILDEGLPWEKKA